MQTARDRTMPRLTSIVAAVASLAIPAAAAPSPEVEAAVPDVATTTQFNVIGREDAPVSIIEFSDLQCPYCARHALETFPRLQQQYVATGKLRYAAADLPLPTHQFAQAAAVAVRCAGEQGSFWSYRAALFAAQDTLGTAPYDRVAIALGLDAAQFTACRREERHAADIRNDMQLAAANGIENTPSFVIGRLVNGEFRGQVVTGAKPYEFFAATIDALLAEQAR